jgi:hypothetical protein
MPNLQPRVREMSKLTPHQGIAVIDSLISTIDETPALKKHLFGIDVRESLKSMRARLLDGAFFSAGMEKALANWGEGVGKWIDPPNKLQS